MTLNDAISNLAQIVVTVVLPGTFGGVRVMDNTGLDTLVVLTPQPPLAPIIIQL